MEPRTIKISYNKLIENQGLLTIITLGHVAHGKSTLVRKITNVKTQKHKAELERNITINLGYANAKIWYDKEKNELFSLPSNVNPYSLSTTSIENNRYKLIQHISFIDCPGHESLMSTMISGTHNFDVAFLLIAANDKIMPQSQTYEHLLALAAAKKKLDIGLVLHNKLDLITVDEALANKAKILEFIDGSPAASLPILPISAQLGTNVDAVLKYLANAKSKHFTRSEQVGEKNEINTPAQLVIIRSFNINKPNVQIESIEGGVIGGSLRSGHLKIGDILEIRPGIVSLIKGSEGSKSWIANPLIARVRTLFSETQGLDIAVPGGLLGIGLTIDSGLAKSNKLVGQICSKIGNGAPIVHELTIIYKRMNRGKEDNSISEGKNLIIEEKLKICIHAVSVLAKVTNINKKQVTITLDSPIAFFKDDNIVIMRNVNNRWQLSGTGNLISVKNVEQIIYPISYEQFKTDDLINTTNLEIIDIDDGNINFEIEDYESLFTRIYPSSTPTALSVIKMEIMAPKLKPHNRITIWENFGAVMDTLKKGFYVQNSVVNVNKVIEEISESQLINCQIHFLRFLQDELACTNSINAKNELLINGKFKDGNIEKVLRNYLRQYRTCHNCNKINSFLYKDRNHLTMIHCNHCGSERSL